MFFGLKPLGWGGDAVGAIRRGVGQEESQDLLQLCSHTFSQHLLQSGVCLGLGILAGEARGDRHFERQTMQGSCLNPGWFSFLFSFIFLGLSSLKPHRCPVGVSLAEVTSRQGGLRNLQGPVQNANVAPTRVRNALPFPWTCGHNVSWTGDPQEIVTFMLSVHSSGVVERPPAESSVLKPELCQPRAGRGGCHQASPQDATEHQGLGPCRRNPVTTLGIEGWQWWGRAGETSRVESSNGGAEQGPGNPSWGDCRRQDHE